MARRDCRLLADFERQVRDLPPMPAGIPGRDRLKLNFTRMVDADGILSVRAVERRSAVQKTIPASVR